MYNSIGTFPPVDKNAPFCQTDIASSINLGTLSPGETTRGTLTGRITCDKDATVNVSLLNVVDKSAPPGLLRLDDAVVRYDVAGSATAHTWQVTGKNQQPFDLNFTVENAGQKIARKTGSLVLVVEAQ